MNKKEDLKVIVQEVANIPQRMNHLAIEASVVVIGSHKIKKVVIWGELIGISANEAECHQETDTEIMGAVHGETMISVETTIKLKIGFPADQCCLIDLNKSAQVILMGKSLFK